MPCRRPIEARIRAGFDRAELLVSARDSAGKRFAPFRQNFAACRRRSPSSPASAEAQTCFTMQAEMMHLQTRGVGGSEDRARYERAYREQANVLARTEARARNAGCFGGGFFLFRRDPDPSCNAARPEASRHAGQPRAARPSPASERPRRRQLPHPRAAGHDERARLRRPRLDIRERPRRKLHLRAQRPIFRATGPSARSAYAPATAIIFRSAIRRPPSTSPQDARSCEAMCPGAEARLFYLPQSGRRAGEHDVDHRRALLVAADGVPVSHQHRFRLHLQAARRIFGHRRRTAGCAADRATIRPRRCRARARRRAKIRRRSPTAPASTCQAPSTRSWRLSADGHRPRRTSRSASSGRPTGATRNRTTW